MISTHEGFCAACKSHVAQTSSVCSSCSARYTRPLGWISATLILFASAFVIALAAFELGPILGAAATDALGLDKEMSEMATAAAIGAIFFGFGSLLLKKLKAWTTYRWRTPAA